MCVYNRYKFQLTFVSNLLSSSPKSAIVDAYNILTIYKVTKKLEMNHFKGIIKNYYMKHG